MGFGQRNIGDAWVDARFAVVPLLVVLVTACASTESAQPIAEAAKPSISCPSQEFSKFLQAFTDSADVQRQFTSLPIEYVLLDGGGGGEYTLRMLGTFEEILALHRPSGGPIFPSKTERTRGRLVTKDVTGQHAGEGHPEERKSPGDRVVMLGIKNSGFVIYYRFAKSNGCWFLHAIHDKSN